MGDSHVGLLGMTTLINYSNVSFRIKTTLRGGCPGACASLWKCPEKFQGREPDGPRPYFSFAKVIRIEPRLWVERPELTRDDELMEYAQRIEGES